jgi:hypothetical protein
MRLTNAHAQRIQHTFVPCPVLDCCYCFDDWLPDHVKVVVKVVFHGS